MVFAVLERGQRSYELPSVLKGVKKLIFMKDVPALVIDFDLACALIALTTASAPFILMISLAHSGFLNVKAVTELERFMS